MFSAYHAPGRQQTLRRPQLQIPFLLQGRLRIRLLPQTHNPPLQATSGAEYPPSGHCQVNHDPDQLRTLTTTCSSHDQVELPYFAPLETKKIMIMINLTMPGRDPTSACGRPRRQPGAPQNDPSGLPASTPHSMIKPSPKTPGQVQTHIRAPQVRFLGSMLTGGDSSRLREPNRCKLSSWLTVGGDQDVQDIPVLVHRPPQGSGSSL